MEKSLSLVVVGTGYVGLVSGACFAALGHSVLCVDTNQEKISALMRGEIPIYEPGLDVIVKDAVRAGTLRFASSFKGELQSPDCVFLAVGTPSNPHDGSADLTAVFAAVGMMAEALQQRTVVVTKSTVPVGTAQKIAAFLASVRADLSCSVASNPEFLREGSAVHDFMHPDRVVVGVSDPHAEQVMRDLYAPLVAKGSPLMVTTPHTAELIKYAANSFLAVKLSYINEIADFCEHVGADVEDVARGIGMDPRIGAAYLKAGPGFGGYCLPKDTRALVKMVHDQKLEARIVQAAVEVNEARKERILARARMLCGNELAGKRIALLGLSFKAETDDLRDAVSLFLIPSLLRHKAALTVFDPIVQARHLQHYLPASEVTALTFSASIADAVKGADLVMILTEWKEFTTLDWQALGATMRAPAVFDLRNLFSSSVMRALGMRYESVGRG